MVAVQWQGFEAEQTHLLEVIMPRKDFTNLIYDIRQREFALNEPSKNTQTWESIFADYGIALKLLFHGFKLQRLTLELGRNQHPNCRGYQMISIGSRTTKKTYSVD